jgi:hypothetical protein
METTRRTIPEIKVEDAMPTIEANMMLIKGADAISKVDEVHIREASVLQTAVVVRTPARGSVVVTKMATKMTARTTRGLMRRTKPKKNTIRTLVTPTRIPIEASIAYLVERLPWRMGDRQSLLPELSWSLKIPTGGLPTPSIKTGRTSPLRSTEMTSGPIFWSQGVSPSF